MIQNGTVRRIVLTVAIPVIATIWLVEEVVVPTVQYPAECWRRSWPVFCREIGRAWRGEMAPSGAERRR